MSGRHERCLAAIRGDELDRLPTYLPGIACEVTSRLLGRKAYSGTGSLHYAEAAAWMKGDAAHGEFVEQMYQDLIELYRLLDIDVFRMPWRMSRRPAKQIDEWTFLYGDPEGEYQVFQYAPDSGDFALIDTSESHDVDFEESIRKRVEAGEAALERGEFAAEPITPEHRDVFRRFGEEFFVVCNGGSICVGMHVEALMLMVTNPELMKRLIMLQSRAAVVLAKALKKEGMPVVLVGGGDLAGNDGPFYSPNSFREVMLPGFSYAMEELRKIDGHYMFRSDGVLWPIADMLFGEAGCPGYGEVDRDVGMTMAAIRERFPKLVCWGNMAVSKLLDHSAEWAKEESERVVAESQRVGYFHGPSNAIMQGTDTGVVKAMFAVR